LLEKFIKKKKSEYVDTTTRNNVDRLNKEIMDVHRVMTENINLIIDREKSLLNVERMSETVKNDSKSFKKMAYETRIKLLLAKYSLFIGVGVILILFIIFKIYF